MAVALSLLASCNPAEDSYTDNAKTYTEQTLSDGFSFTQADEEGNIVPDGNYFTFTTSPAVPVTVLQKKADGSENILVRGESTGKFAIVPTRGSDPTQKFYVRTMNPDGTYIEAEKTANVYVPGDLLPEIKLLCSDAGQKIWKWDTSWHDNDGNPRAWGNGKYKGDPGDDFGNGISGIWWGCSPAELTGQLDHSNTHEATGEESEKAYMEFNEDGTINTYNADGVKIRSGRFSVEGYNGGQRDADNWSIGKLKVEAGTILFPFEINKNGQNLPTEFDIMKLSTGELVLACSSNGVGNECTWWHFKSNSDGVGNLTNNATKAWTWDISFVKQPDGYNCCWGNGKYMGDPGDDFAEGTAGTWWGTLPAGFDEELANGANDPNAYMEFCNDGTVKSYDKDGNVIRSGTWEITYANKGDRDANNWAIGTLKTDALLYPRKINHLTEGELTEFDILKLTSKQMVLVYGGNGKGEECTWWRFKVKE